MQVTVEHPPVFTEQLIPEVAHRQVSQHSAEIAQPKFISNREYLSITGQASGMEMAYRKASQTFYCGVKNLFLHLIVHHSQIFMEKKNNTITLTAIYVEVKSYSLGEISKLLLKE